MITVIILFILDIQQLSEDVRISSGPYFELQVEFDSFKIITNLMKDKEKRIKLDHEIKEFVICNEMCYFLVANQIVTSYNFNNPEDLQQISTPDAIASISCTSSKLYGSTSHKIYLLAPTSILIHEFPSHQRIKKISSGLEHTAVLTNNGDLFTFGCGLRGQLGHGDVRSYETPVLVEALAGIKIIDISCAGFHTIAVSSFGDVYSFGWNTNGQLGLKKAPQGTFRRHEGGIKCQQVFTLPQLIEIEDEDEAVKSVFCGHKHTILMTVAGRMFAAGLNNYGQLGCASHEKDIDKFTEIPIKIDQNAKISCGYWTTHLTVNEKFEKTPLCEQQQKNHQ